MTRDQSHASRLQVRARVRGDLDLLRSSFLPELTSTIEIPGRDYPYRGYCSKEQMSAALMEIAMSIDYSNYKSQVIKTQGLAREQLYAQVWSVMNNAEQKIKANTADNKRWESREKGGWFNDESANGNGKSWKNSPYAQRQLPLGGTYSTPTTRSLKPVTTLYPEDAIDSFDPSYDPDMPPEDRTFVNTAINHVHEAFDSADFANEEMFGQPVPFLDELDEEMRQMAARNQEVRDRKKNKKNKKKKGE